MTDLQESIRLQALAILLGIPTLSPLIRRKVLFDFLNVVKIKFTDEEMKAIEKTFQPACCSMCGKPYDSQNASSISIVSTQDKVKCEKCGLEYADEEELRFLIRQYGNVSDEELTLDGIKLKQQVLKHLAET